MTDDLEATVVAESGSETNEGPKLELYGTRQLTSWMREHNVSFAFSTYQVGKFFTVGMQPDKDRLSVYERTFPRCMGLCTDAEAQTIYMASLYQIWRFDNVLEPGQQMEGGYDRLYVPQVAYTTGDLDAHDMGIGKDGKPIFVNTLFSCLGTIDDAYSFMPVWKPKFITKLAAEDRCHLNGLAMEDGEPRYVTAVSQTDVNEGWREHRENGGVVIDVKTNEIVCEGLSMPHSPRLHKGKLWLLNAGTGYFGYVDLKKKIFKPVTFCPGFLRGMSFVDDFAVVCMSKLRDNKTFLGLELDKNLEEKGVAARCALQVIDLKTGDAVHSLTLDGVVEELYDVITLKGVNRPQLVGIRNEEICRILRVGPGLEENVQ